MQIPSREHESRTIPARFAALLAAVALALCCTLPLAACEGGSFSDSQAANPAAVQIADIPEYFYPNSLAIVFPYVRAFVSTITLQANMQPVVLPTINLMGLTEELKEKTTVIE